MADTKTDSSSTPLSDDPANPTKGLSAKRTPASHPAGAEPVLDTLFHRTSLRFYCAANVVIASEAREPDAYGDSSHRLLDGSPRMVEIRPGHMAQATTIHRPADQLLERPLRTSPIASGSRSCRMERRVEAGLTPRTFRVALTPSDAATPPIFLGENCGD